MSLERVYTETAYRALAFSIPQKSVISTMTEGKKMVKTPNNIKISATRQASVIPAVFAMSFPNFVSAAISAHFKARSLSFNLIYFTTRG